MTIKAEFIGDNTLELEWDANSPEFAVLNDMTQDELQSFIIEALERFIEKEEDKYAEHLIR